MTSENIQYSVRWWLVSVPVPNRAELANTVPPGERTSLRRLSDGESGSGKF